MYELFDEVMDFGYPQFSDPKILQEYVFLCVFLVSFWFLGMVDLELFKIKI